MDGPSIVDQRRTTHAELEFLDREDGRSVRYLRAKDVWVSGLRRKTGLPRGHKIPAVCRRRAP